MIAYYVCTLKKDSQSYYLPLSFKGEYSWEFTKDTSLSIVIHKLPSGWCDMNKEYAHKSNIS